ncbi:MAG: NAD-dependent epimerase/dehydratase family protein [bacterium]|nr:NAD-dependent epimerase/dehydratase family protein [bacterium]
MSKPKRLLITGGAGFVGINLVSCLLDTRQYKITVVDNLSAGNYQLLKEVVSGKGSEIEDRFSSSIEKVCFYPEDILNKDAIGTLLKGQHQVVHLAAQTGVIDSLRSPYEDAAINITGTLNLLTAALDHSIGKFIFASSAAPLGEQTPPIHETQAPRPLSPYAASKLAGEGYCSAFCGSWGLNTVVLRFSNLYGPNSFHKGSVIAAFIKNILDGQPLTVYGDGQQTRDFLYVEDLAHAIHTILQSDSPALKGELFQLGTGIETSVNRLIEHLEEIALFGVDVRYEPERKGEIKRNYTSIEKVKQQLGYSPTVDLQTGLERTWQWFRGFHR